uniref:Lethal giant larvae homologue 2 domain-containing protein n=1 Tax=Plectus sambesii TaxID=2011161 RepID=A0A914WLH6_9BILA
MQNINGIHQLLVGTETGNVYALDTKSLDMTDFIIYQDTVIQSVPEDLKNAGQVEALAAYQGDESKLLIGFNRGLIVLYDTQTHTVKHTYITGQTLESIHWHADGKKFVSAHNDGSYIVWSVEDNSKPMLSPNIPFGPFPCMPIKKIVWKTTAVRDDELMVFCGGMPRASYGDRFTVSAQRKEQQVVFDFSSKVIDFVTVDEGDGDMEDPSSLVVLCEEELVAIDLRDSKWGAYRLPYFFPIHSSPVTAAFHVADVADAVYDTIERLGEQQHGRRQFASTNQWPIAGGVVDDSALRKDIIVTGHEDGSVKFWTAGSVRMKHLLTVSSAKQFEGFVDPLEAPAEDEEGAEWPPFRKVGLYDPFSDDPRFSVQRVFLDAKTGTLAVGGSAGQTVIFNLADEEKSIPEMSVVDVAIVSEDVNFVWKGHKKLNVEKNLHFTNGYQPLLVVQTDPPASVTSVCVQTELSLVAVGTAYGYALCDYAKKAVIFSKCLLSADELAVHNASAMEGAMTRFKSFKKSIRDSFRRRRRRGADSPSKKSPTPEPDAGSKSSSSPKKQPSPRRVRQDNEDDDEIKPVERAIEARSDFKPTGSSDALPSLVRILYFADTFIASPTAQTPTFWVGTNGGRVIAHLITPPKTSEADEIWSLAQCQLAKEIQLRHGAPVLGLAVVGMDDAVITKSTPGPHRVVICSEEQIKSFSLPALKPGKHKFKLTGLDGSRIRKVQFAKLQSVYDDTKYEHFIILVTNLGEVNAFSVHNFRRYMKATMTKQTDVHGILSTVLTSRGEALYLGSRGCEWQRVAVGAKNFVQPAFKLELPEGCRPPPAAAQSTLSPSFSTSNRNSAISGEQSDAGVMNDTNNSSTLPSDATMDSIRDYTSNGIETVQMQSSSEGVVTITTKVTKTTTHENNGSLVSVEKKQETTTATLSNGNADQKELTSKELGEISNEICKMKKMTTSEEKDAVKVNGNGHDNASE